MIFAGWEPNREKRDELVRTGAKGLCLENKQDLMEQVGDDESQLLKVAIQHRKGTG